MAAIGDNRMILLPALPAATQAHEVRISWSPAAIFANAIRVLSMDAVQKANSGHPGMPMGMADIAEALWRHHLKPQPGQPRLV